MPIFEYRCDKCDKTEDKLVTRPEADAGVEFVCDCEEGAIMKKGDKISAAALRFKGNWSGTTGSF